LLWKLLKIETWNTTGGHWRCICNHRNLDDRVTFLLNQTAKIGQRAGPGFRYSKKGQQNYPKECFSIYSAGSEKERLV
jgi:hypothetical protein